MAQVSQDTSFSGRLVDGSGVPLAGPVSLELWIYDALSRGSAVYAEEHTTVQLDTDGRFSVLLGTGTSTGGPFPPYDPLLFATPERYIEVRTGGATLTPRVPVASVPWAFVAQQANSIVPDPDAPFVDCGNGTVADPASGLLWEMKGGTYTGTVLCDTTGCPDPHDVRNLYHWTSTGSSPDGDAFNDFLAKVNDPIFGAAASTIDTTGCLAGHCDWRLPTITELLTITDCSHGTPCIDPVFGATGVNYWTSSTDANNSLQAWRVAFSGGSAPVNVKTLYGFVRAVRVGSCY